MTAVRSQAPTLWMDQDSARLARDKVELAGFAPQLRYEEPTSDPQTHGIWRGVIPRWPFLRPEPEGLETLLGRDDFEVAIVYPSAYPMTPPVFFPLSVTPEPYEQSQAIWHVAPGGSLCLLQSTGGWIPEASIIDLVQKAAGWRVEYALMKAGVIEQMTTNGIVSDPSHDALVTQAASALTQGSAERLD